MNLFIFAWFGVGALCVLGSLWFMKTHEKQLMDEIPAAQIFGCIPPPTKWGVILIMLFFGPAVLLWAFCEGVRQWRQEEDEEVPGRPATRAVPVFAPRRLWVVLFALFGAILGADHWATAYPAKPFATLLQDQTRAIGFMVFAFGLPSVLVRRNPLPDLRDFVLAWAPIYLVGLVPLAASATVGWRGGWILGIGGLALGVPAGAATGWLFTRWTLPDLEKKRERRSATELPIVFAVVFALFGAYTWAIMCAKPHEAWAIVVGWILFSLPGALVGRPILGLQVASPFVVLTLVPVVASMTVGWMGGWMLGIAGAAAGAAAGAVMGWLFNRWIMPEYDKRRARESAVQPPGQE